jgi:hypothetical protein
VERLIDRATATCHTCRMDGQLAVVLVSTGGSVIVGLGGMWIATNQFGKRLDSVERRMERLEDTFNVFKKIVNGKLQALDNKVAKIMEKIK